MKFKNTSGKTINVKYGDMITIQNGEIVELPLTYEREGLERVIEEVKLETPKVEVKKTKAKKAKKK